MVNPFDFDGGEAVRRAAEPVAETIATLRVDADAADVPVIYVNDNFGRWHSERSRLVEEAGPSIAGGIITPRDTDLFIIKPQFSGFYSTNLAVLLPKLGVRRLILTGVAAEICVLFTAADAHMRDYAIWVPDDAVVAIDADRGRAALGIMRSVMGATTMASTALSIRDWSRG